jgi:hypothetical protein
MATGAFAAGRHFGQTGVGNSSKNVKDFTL